MATLNAPDAQQVSMMDYKFEMPDGSQNSRRYGRWTVLLIPDAACLKKNKSNPMGLKFEETREGLRVKDVQKNSAAMLWNEQRGVNTQIKVGDIVLNFKEQEGAWVSTQGLMVEEMTAVTGNLDVVELCLCIGTWQGGALNTKPPEIGNLPPAWASIQSKVFFPQKLSLGRTDINWTTKFAIYWILTPSPENPDKQRGRDKFEIVSIGSETYPYKYPQNGGVDIYADQGAYLVREKAGMLGTPPLQDLTVVQAIRIWYRPAGSGGSTGSSGTSTPDSKSSSSSSSSSSKKILRAGDAKAKALETIVEVTGRLKKLTAEAAKCQQDLADIRSASLGFQIPPEGTSTEGHEEKLKEFYAQYDPKNAKVIPVILKKYNGKETEMWIKLLEKYNA